MATTTTIESFDLVTSNADITAKGFNSSTGTITAGIGRFGGAGYRMDATTDDLVRYKGSDNGLTVTMWWKIDSLPSSGNTAFMGAVNNSTVTSTGSLGNRFNQILAIYINSTGSISVSGSDYGGIQGKGSTATNVISGGAWHHLEIQVTFGTSGNVTITVDGSEEFNVDGSYRNTSGSVVNNWALWGASQGITIDDLVVQDDTSVQQPLIGAHQMHTLVPSGAGSVSDFTGTYADVDELGVNDGDTSYISSGTLGHKHEFTLADIAESPTVIHSVSMQTVAKKTDVGVMGYKTFIKSGATEVQSNEIAADETYSVIDQVYLTDPDTAAAWTLSGVQALTCGVEVTST